MNSPALLDKYLINLNYEKTFVRKLVNYSEMTTKQSRGN